MKHGFKFTDYVPQFFCELREDHSSLDPANYLLFLTSKYIFYEITSPGKTGAMFYRPSDTEHQFIIRVLAMQKIYQLCPRLFCVALHCELKLKGQMREIRACKRVG